MYDTQLVTLYLAMFEICLAFVMHVYIVYLCFSYKDSIYKGIRAVYLRYFFIIPVCFCLSVIFHPGSKGDFFFTFQMFVSFTIFLEAGALVPQLVHLKQN